MITEKEFKLKYLGKTINYLDIDWTVIGYHLSTEDNLDSNDDFENWQYVEKGSEYYIDRLIFSSYDKNPEDIALAWAPNSLNDFDVIFEPERSFIKSCVEFKIDQCMRFEFI